MIRRIFLPSGKTCLMRGSYILIFLLLHIIFLLAFFSLVGIPVVPLLCILIYTWVKININAQRCRDSGGKARYIVISSILVYFASLVVAGLGYVGDDDCMLLGVRIYFAYDGLVFFFLMLAPTQIKKQTNSIDRISI